MTAKVNNEINYCLRCGNLLDRAERFGRLRPVCPVCDCVFFEDPKVAVAALIDHDGQVLLTRRANDPQRGLWTLPAGFVDAGEHPARALVRECLEETGLQTHIIGLFDVLHGQEHPRGAHILIVFLAEALSGSIDPGDDVDQVAFFPLNKLPPLAFSTTHEVIGKWASQKGKR